MSNLRQQRRAERLAGQSSKEGQSPKEMIQQARIEQRRTGQVVKSKNQVTNFTVTKFNGPGAALKYILRTKYKLKACGSCITTATLMDSKGIEWCRGNIDYIANEMYKNVQTNKWLVLINQFEYWIRGLQDYKNLIVEAIELYENQNEKQPQSSERTP